MIAKLTGAVDEIYLESIIINVRDVGYLVYITKNLLNSLKPGEKITLYIEQHMYENNIKLYGFSSSDEQEVLRLLIKVKGISHKIAVNLIDNIGYNNVILHIRNKNDSSLKTKGIGEKLTKRIVTELYENALKFNIDIDQNNVQNNSSYNEAISALVHLGYSSSISHQIVKEVLAKNDISSTSEIVCLALKKL